MCSISNLKLNVSFDMSNIVVRVERHESMNFICLFAIKLFYHFKFKSS